MTQRRCSWVTSDPLYQAYHDLEWGVPVYDDRLLFEMLCLEGAQAGLNWLTVLKKREHYRSVFDQFDVHKIAEYDENKINALLLDPGIIRHRLKINATITNARAVLRMQTAGVKFSDYLWQFVDHRSVINAWQNGMEIPTSTPISDAMSKDLKMRGFKFVGTTICYAFMQATGMVNDHTMDCFCHPKTI